MIAIDLLEMDAIEGVEFRQMDFHDPEAPARLREWLGGLADGVLSDMAANATGHRKTDQLRIVGLVELAADFAAEVLAPGGFFLAKVLQGGAEGDLLARLKREFADRAPREAEGQPRRQRRALPAGDGVQGDEGGLKLNGFDRFQFEAAIRGSHREVRRWPALAGSGPNAFCSERGKADIAPRVATLNLTRLRLTNLKQISGLPQETDPGATSTSLKL